MYQNIGRRPLGRSAAYVGGKHYNECYRNMIVERGQESLGRLVNGMKNLRVAYKCVKVARTAEELLAYQEELAVRRHVLHQAGIHRSQAEQQRTLCRVCLVPGDLPTGNGHKHTGNAGHGTYLSIAAALTAVSVMATLEKNNISFTF